jgi:hypothetical protein
MQRSPKESLSINSSTADIACHAQQGAGCSCAHRIHPIQLDCLPASACRGKCPGAFCRDTGITPTPALKITNLSDSKRHLMMQKFQPVNQVSKQCRYRTYTSTPS